MPSKPRARGRTYVCACTVAKIRLTRRGPDARHDGWSYLWCPNDCGGGVRLRFTGAKVVDVQQVFPDEAQRVRAAATTALAPLSVDAQWDQALETLKPAAREKVVYAMAQVRERYLDIVSAGIELGEQLLVAKHELGHRHFGVFLQKAGITYEKAETAMRIALGIRETPQFQELFLKLGQEKTAVLMRLPLTKRVEILEHGVPVGGALKPIVEATFRETNAAVRSLVGKSARGRKAKPAPAKATERWGMPAEIATPFADALRNLHAIKALVKEGRLPKAHTLALGRLWRRIYNLAYELHAERGLGDIVDYAR